MVDTLEAALWCFLTTDNFTDCILKAVNLGDDTDTVTAVTGGLAKEPLNLNVLEFSKLISSEKKQHLKDK